MFKFRIISPKRLRGRGDPHAGNCMIIAGAPQAPINRAPMSVSWAEILIYRVKCGLGVKD